MHLFDKAIVALIFVTAAGCGGSTTNPKTGEDVVVAESGASDSKKAECSAVEKNFNELDEAGKGKKGLARGRALTPALEKMSKEFKQSPPKTPGLDKATAEMVVEADLFAAKMKELIAIFDEMEQINVSLQAWQTKAEKSGEDFDNACSKAPKDECEAMGKRVTNIPHLEGDEFGRYANELEKFVKAAGEFEVANPGLEKAWKNMLSVLAEPVKSFRRLAELTDESKKVEPPTAQLKAKFDQVREICGLPERK
jgi:hypothetical protein